MTEQEWLTCADPDRMLAFLVSPTVCQNFWQLHPVERKIRLFAVGCCRRIWDMLTHEDSRQALTFAEWMAEDSCQSFPEREYKCALKVVDATHEWPKQKAASAVADTLLKRAIRGQEIRGLTSVRFSPEANTPIVPTEVYSYALTVATRCRIAIALAAHSDMDPAIVMAEQAEQACRLRCIFGNPFRPITVSPTWLTPMVTSLAHTIYDERAFDRMPILADALEEAGCDNTDILTHCRQPAEHVKGCWVVDLVLGKT